MTATHTDTAKHVTPIKHILASQHAADGDGVQIQRVALFNQPLADPFLLLDELASDNPDDYIGGFPPHPHRGMETLTYLRHGTLTHTDHMGNKGEIHSGGAQWMSAGRGVIHSEMPARELDRLHGFQLWINLPASDKMQAAQYRDVEQQEMTEIMLPNAGKARVIAGNWQLNGKPYSGPLMSLAADARYLDVSLKQGQSLHLSALPDDYTLLAYPYDGQLQTNIHSPSRSLLVIDHRGEAEIVAATDVSFLLLAGRPLREPVVHYGPFVMNSHEEIEQAIRDYQNGTLTN